MVGHAYIGLHWTDNVLVFNVSCTIQHWAAICSESIYKYRLVPKETSKNNCGIIFQCWSRLTVNIYFVISRNKCNKFVSYSMTQQYTICIDLSNTAVGPKNRHKCMVWPSLQLHHSPGTWITWFHVPGKHDTALTAVMKLGNIVYFCTSRDAHWNNHDHVIRIVI